MYDSSDENGRVSSCGFRSLFDIIIMELKNWLLAVRIINIIASLLMVGFEVWYIIDLFQSDASLLTIIVRLFTPAFVMYSHEHSDY